MSESVQEASEAASESAGRVLAVARERLDMSVAEVARALRLGVKQIEAIESEDYARLPGRTFVRGFLRNYARLVQLDPDRVIALAGFNGAVDTSSRHIEAPSQRIKFSDQTGRHWVRWLLAACIAVAVASWAVLDWLGPEGGKMPGTPRVASSAPAAAVPSGEAASTGEAAPANLPRPSAEPGRAPAEPAPAAVPATPAVETPPPTPKPAVAPQPDGGAPAAAGTSLVFGFSGPSWVEVRDKSGKRIFSRLNEAGTQQTVSGEPPFSLVIGGAPKVTLSYKGAPVDLAAHTKADVARLKLE